MLAFFFLIIASFFAVVTYTAKSENWILGAVLCTVFMFAAAASA